MIDDTVIVAIITLIGTLAAQTPLTQKYRVKAAQLGRLLTAFSEVMEDGKITKEEATRLLRTYRALHLH